MVFWKKVSFHKDILKLTDLYLRTYLLRTYFQFFIWSQELQLFLRCLISLRKVWWLLKPILSTQAKIMWNYHIRYTVASVLPPIALFLQLRHFEFGSKKSQLSDFSKIWAKLFFFKGDCNIFFFHFNANLITNPDYDCSLLSFEIY